MNAEKPPDLAAIIRTLQKHRVKFVVIGALAGLLQGVPLTRTLDVDIVPEASKENRRRLAAALRDMDATLRLPDPSEIVAIPLDEHTFDNIQSMTLTTMFGPLDVLFKPEGTEGYEDLVLRATTVEDAGVAVPVISVEDLMLSKQAAGRPKDLEHLLVIERHLRG
jgi:hypothetical protein